MQASQNKYSTLKTAKARLKALQERKTEAHLPPSLVEAAFGCRKTLSQGIKTEYWKTSDVLFWPHVQTGVHTPPC